MDLTDESPETIEWQRVRVAAADAALGDLDTRDVFEQSVKANLADTRRFPVIRRGNRWFQKLVLDPSAEEPAIVVRDAPTGEPRVLFDPNRVAAERGTSVMVMQYEPSPDGAVIAVSFSASGTEHNELLLIESESGEFIAHGVDASIQYLTWRPDSQGFWYSAREVVDGAFEFPIHDYTIASSNVQRLGTPSGLMDPRVLASADGRHVVLRTGNTEQRCDWVITDGELRPFLKDLPGGFNGDVDASDLIAIVDDGAPRGRLMRIPIESATDTTTWTELVPESEDVLRFVAIVDEVIVLGYLRDAASGLRLLDRDGSLLDEIDLGEPCTIGMHPVGVSHPALPMFAVGDGEISFVRSTFSSSWTTWRYVIDERRLERLSPTDVTLDDLSISTVAAVSSDGAEVLAHIVHRSDVDRSTPQPTLVYGYGGFCAGYLPSLDATFAAWIQTGGVFVLTHLRGGSEFGAEWWRQGTRERKQQTFDDLYAIAEKLIDDGVSSSDQMVVKGESNGGLLTAAAVVQRPDLWAAVVCDVPIADLLNYHRDPLTHAIGRGEYGDPLDPADAEWLRRISPVQNARPSHYPPTLVTGGANDPRCPVWHVRTLVDALERTQLGGAPILMKIYEGQGHAAGGLDGTSAKSGDWLAFAAHHAGLRTTVLST